MPESRQNACGRQPRASLAGVITHVLFDFFGTLVGYSASRTEQGYGRSFALLQRAGTGLDYDGFLALWTRVSAEFDQRAEATHREFSMTELGCAFAERALPREAPPGFVDEFVATYLDEWNQGVRYLDGVPALLERLARRYVLGVVTNTHDAALVPGHLERMGVAGHFRDVVTSVEYGLRKPHPGIFRHALGRLEAKPGDCVYVGDNPVADYAGAAAAELRCYLIDPRAAAPIPAAARLDTIHGLEARLASG